MNTVPRCFPGETIAILGSGPSLTYQDVTYCRGRARVIAIKESVRMAPWADVFYAPDKKFFRYHGDEVADFAGMKFTLDHMVGDDTAVHLQIGDRTGLSVDPTTLCTGYDSGYACINLAVLLGAARIVLLGYDMQERDGRDHWFGAHVWRTRPPYQQILPQYPSLVGPLVTLGVEVINTTKDSALQCWPHRPLAETLPALEAVA